MDVANLIISIATLLASTFAGLGVLIEIKRKRDFEKLSNQLNSQQIELLDLYIEIKKLLDIEKDLSIQYNFNIHHNRRKTDKKLSPKIEPAKVDFKIKTLKEKLEYKK